MLQFVRLEKATSVPTRGESGYQAICMRASGHFMNAGFRQRSYTCQLGQSRPLSGPVERTEVALSHAVKAQLGAKLGAFG